MIEVPSLVEHGSIPAGCRDCPVFQWDPGDCLAEVAGILQPDGPGFAIRMAANGPRLAHVH